MAKGCNGTIMFALETFNSLKLVKYELVTSQEASRLPCEINEVERVLPTAIQK